MESLTPESVVNFLYRFRAFTDQLTVLRLQELEEIQRSLEELG